MPSAGTCRKATDQKVLLSGRVPPLPCATDQNKKLSELIGSPSFPRTREVVGMIIEKQLVLSGRRETISEYESLKWGFDEETCGAWRERECSIGGV